MQYRALVAALHIDAVSQTSYAFVDQVTLEGWFAFDFTVSELKLLRKRQRLNFRDSKYDGQFSIPTLTEHIAVAKSAERPVAIIPEIKHPSFVNALDILRNSSQRFEDIVLKVLEKYETVFLQK